MVLKKEDKLKHDQVVRKGSGEGKGRKPLVRR